MIDNIKTASTESYLSDESKETGYAKGVFLPGTIEEISEIMKWSFESGESILIQGARTGVMGAAVPHGEYILNMTCMNSISGFSYNEETNKYCITAQAGVTLDQINNMLSSKEADTSHWSECSIKAWEQYCKSDAVLRFPADPTETTASIGGILATSAFGPYIKLLGRLISYVDSFTLVEYDGRIVSGDDINHDRYGLIEGSEGLYGAIAEMTCRLVELPKPEMSLLIGFDSYEQMTGYYEMVQRVTNISENLYCADFFSSEAIRYVMELRKRMDEFADIPSIRERDSLWLEIYDQSYNYDNILIMLAEIAEEIGISIDDTVVVTDDRNIQRLKKMRHAIITGFSEDSTEHSLVYDVKMDIKDLDGISGELKQVTETSGKCKMMLMFGHVTGSFLSIRILVDKSADEILSSDMNRQIINLLKKYCSRVSSEYGIGTRKKVLNRELGTVYAVVTGEPDATSVDRKNYKMI